MVNVIEVADLTKKLGKFVLGEMSFELPLGYIIGLIGENGAGKTTLLHLLLGLYQPTKGKVKVFGETYSDKEVEIRQKISEASDPLALALRFSQISAIYKHLFIQRYIVFISDDNLLFFRYTLIKHFYAIRTNLYFLKFNLWIMFNNIIYICL